jgi:hypothetical protein
MAAGEGFILVSVPHSGTVSELNSPDHETMLARFANEILGAPHKVFAVSEEDKLRITQLFKEKNTKGELPKPIEIKAPSILVATQESKAVEDEVPESLFSLFGAGNVDIIREEKK